LPLKHISCCSSDLSYALLLGGDAVDRHRINPFVLGMPNASVSLSMNI